MITSLPAARRFRRLLRGLMAAFSLSLAAALLPAAELSKKTFNLPADDAAKVLKVFSEQSGEQIVYPVEQVRGVRTQAVQGEFTPREALDALLKDTGLVAVQDDQTGALAVRRETSAEKNGAGRLQATALEPAVKLEEYRVLGSRLRQADAEGPSPFNSYDREFIDATGAMTLAGFLNMLPQTYSGIGTGRGSAPNELNPEFGQRTETSTPLYNYVLGNSSAPAAQTGVSGVSLRGLGSGSTLVLVDGRRVAQSGSGNRSTDSRQGFVDLNTIPLGMIDHIEVSTDGASAIYGADAVAGVINIVLKKNWTGQELSGSYKASQHGGGRERTVSLTSGFVAGKLRGTVSLDFYDRQSLKASDRSFSKNQNHTGIIATYDSSGNPVYGRDLRLTWGYPAVVQAYTGTLAGITEAGGNATRFAVVKSGTTGTVTLADFTAVGPGSTGTAAYIQRGNTSEFVDLIPQSERYGVYGNFNYKIKEWLEAYATYSFSDTRGLYATQPAVSSASTYTGYGNYKTVVPAAYNPFGQDVVVGLIHYGFGSVTQRTHTKAHSGTVGLRGTFGKTWEWDASAGWQHQVFGQITRDFNGAAITAALSNADASLRLNPFIDQRIPGNEQSAIYETMALYPTTDSMSDFKSYDFSANGTLYEIWGGPIQMAWGGSSDRNKNRSDSVSYTTAVTPVRSTSHVQAARTSYAAFTEVGVPLFGKPNARLFLRRLELSLAARYEDHASYSKTVPKYGITWSPHPSLLLRASYSEGFRAPSLTEYEVSTSSTTATLTDPKRTPASTSGVVVTSGSNPFITAETSRNLVYGVLYELPYLKGLSLQANYYNTVQKNVVQKLSAQTIVNNEAIFPTRVTRAAATDSDLALGQPGQITAVDLTFVNFGEVRNESVDYGLDYNLPWEQLGRWRVNVSATRTLKSTRQLAPGQPAVVDDGDTYAPPKWKLNGSLFWSRGNWNASLFYTYLDGFTSNLSGNTLTSSYPIPSVYKFDVRGGYKFKHGVWRGHGKDLRVTVGITNLFDKKPPFSDTIFGYNGGLHSDYALGRAFEFSFMMPY